MIPFFVRTAFPMLTCVLNGFAVALRIEEGFHDYYDSIVLVPRFFAERRRQSPCRRSGFARAIRGDRLGRRTSLGHSLSKAKIAGGRRSGGGLPRRPTGIRRLHPASCPEGVLSRAV